MDLPTRKRATTSGCPLLTRHLGTASLGRGTRGRADDSRLHTPQSPTPAKMRARTAKTGVPRANAAPVRSGSAARSTAAPHRAAPEARRAKLQKLEGLRQDGQRISPANAAQRIEDLLACRIRRITWATQVSPTNLLASGQRPRRRNKEQRQQEC